MVIYGPDVKPGRATGMTEMIDITPTCEPAYHSSAKLTSVFDLFGIKEQYSHSGKTLVPLLTDATAKHKDYSFSEGGFLVREEPLLEVSLNLLASIFDADPSTQPIRMTRKPVCSMSSRRSSDEQ